MTDFNVLLGFLISRQKVHGLVFKPDLSKDLNGPIEISVGHQKFCDPVFHIVDLRQKYVTQKKLYSVNNLLHVEGLIDILIEQAINSNIQIKYLLRAN